VIAKSGHGEIASDSSKRNKRPFFTLCSAICSGSRAMPCPCSANLQIRLKLFAENYTTPGRLFSILVGGMPVVLYLWVLSAELLFLVLAILALQRQGGK
jgi:hypothetical protein